jgi:hypothetical protein
MKNRHTTFTAILFALGFLALSPLAQAVGPDTDGSIPGSNNGEGIGVLVSRTTGVWNTGTGFEALSQLTAGNQNTATGLRALFSDINGGFNTATGVFSLFSNTSGFFNSATGAYSLANNISGNYNTANGYAALYRNTAIGNTATGYAALYHNTTGSVNTANGAGALLNNTTGSSNTAGGANALFKNTTGDFNTATGFNALGNNTTGEKNTANGYGALFSNIDGADNNAIGYQALLSHQTGSFNNALGFNALVNDTDGVGNTAVGDSALQSNTGNSNTAIGQSAGANATTGDGNVYVGAGMFGVAGEDSHTYISNINTTSVSGGGTDTVTINLSTGLLGHLSSSRRYKEEIRPMNDASEALYRLKPVTYRYKKEIDSIQSPAFGLIAEEVAEVNPDLVARNAKGQLESVHYEMVNAMLLNEFLKEHHKVQEQQATIAELKKDFRATVAQLTARLEEQAAQIQKVSAHFEVGKFARRTAGRIRRGGSTTKIALNNQ